MGLGGGGGTQGKPQLKKCKQYSKIILFVFSFMSELYVVGWTSNIFT
jgi:hypothetical protein